VKRNFVILFVILLLITGCSNIPQKTILPTPPWYSIINANLACVSVFQIEYGYEIFDFAPFSEHPQVTPHFIGFDQEGNIYMDDQGNDRILRYSDFNQPPAIIQIPSYREAATSQPYQPFWLDMEVTDERIYILHNAGVTNSEHMLLSVHAMDGTEIRLIDLSTSPQFSENERNRMEENWVLYSLRSDAHGGVVIYSVDSGDIHINQELEVSILNPPGTNLYSNRFLLPGWNGMLYSYQPGTSQIIMLHYITGQSTEWSQFNDRLEELGLNGVYLLGVDLSGNALFTARGRGHQPFLGMYNSNTQQVFLTLRNISHNRYSDYYYVFDPDGNIYRLNGSNVPESRELLRCEFVPLD
jgi:hypothetical protein